MPMLKVNPDEDEKDYVSRFMADEVMGDYFPDMKQRAAVAYSTYRRAMQTKSGYLLLKRRRGERLKKLYARTRPEEKVAAEVAQAKLPRVYCDLDGVLSDFDGHAKKLNAGSPRDSKFWQKLLEKPCAYWEEMPPLPWATSFWSSLLPYSPEILSSAPPMGFIAHATGKRNWAQRHLQIDPARVHITTGATGKANYADADAILIDDSRENCAAFRKAGGRAILFTSAGQALAELKGMVEKPKG